MNITRDLGTYQISVNPLAVYSSIWYWMGFFIDAVVIPHPGATKAGDDDGGVVASTGAVIFPVVERHRGNDDQEDGN